MVKDFEKISSIDKELKENNIGVFTKAQEVDAFQDSFEKLIKLYSVISILILVVGLAVSGIMLYKVSVERYSEVGLLGALGYSKANIKKILNGENVCFALVAIVSSCVLILGLNMFYKIQFGYGLSLEVSHFLLLTLINLVLTMGLTTVISLKLINTEPAEALRK